MIRIEHLEDLNEAISGAMGVIVYDRDAYTVVDHVHRKPGMITNPVLRQCRGLKFAPNGAVLARPFHEFLRWEQGAPPPMDLGAPHRVLEKLDGHMVHPCRLGPRLVFMARMGLTPVAEAAGACADASTIGLCEEALAAGITPIFEFTCGLHPVVLRYGRPTLTLVGARETVSGRYLVPAEVLSLAVAHGVALVRDLGGIADQDGFASAAWALEGSEGYVLVAGSGERVVLQSRAYARRRHKMPNPLSEAC